jgi:hypothetical protein
MSLSPRLGLSYILPQQAQKHVTANQSFRRLDALVQPVVKSATLTAEPLSPAEGDAYIVPAGASGPQWSLMAANSIAAFQDGAWSELAPRTGWRVYVEALAAARVFDGIEWVAEGVVGGDAEFAKLGVNTAPDATNRLAVKSDAALFNHDDQTPGTGDCRVVINKSAAAKTASAIFQTNASGRAEFGLNGSDDFSLKVSADGAQWTNAVVIKPDAKFGINTAAPAALLHLHLDGGDVSPSLSSGQELLIDSEADGVSFAGVVANASATKRMVFNGTKSRGTLAAPAACLSGDYTFSLIGNAFDGSAAQSTAGIEFVVDGAVSAGVSPQRIVFGTGAAASRTERMRITSGGDVGIGVTAPSSRLDVDGAIKVKSYVKTALPSAATSGSGAMIYVSNEIGGAVIAFSDGTNWRRVTDRAVVS